MVWPVALTDNTDLKKHVFVQLIVDLLEGSNTFDELHKGAAIAIREWLQSDGGIDDADNVKNSDSFKPVSANWVVWQILRGQIETEYKALADEYRIEYFRLIRRTTALNAEGKERGGVVGSVHVVKQQRRYFTERSSQDLFDDFREG